MKFKICCIQSTEEAEQAITAGAWALGLVADMPSGPGPLADLDIRTIARAAKGRIKRFLLTSRTAPDDVVDHIRFCETDVVQLVDIVPVQTYETIRQFCPDVLLVQVVHVQGNDAIHQAHEAARHCDMVLLDSGRTDGPVRELGGTGRTHNWDISRTIVAELDCPVILAGGLNPHNAMAAVNTVKPHALDICSGLRDKDFVLDVQKLNAFVEGQAQST